MLSGKRNLAISFGRNCKPSLMIHAYVPVQWIRNAYTKYRKNEDAVHFPGK